MTSLSAANTFEGLVSHFEGQIFLLAQGDIVFICRDADISAVQCHSPPGSLHDHSERGS